MQKDGSVVRVLPNKVGETMKSIEKVEKFAQLNDFVADRVYHLSGEGAFEVLAQARKSANQILRLLKELKIKQFKPSKLDIPTTYLLLD